MAKLSGSTPSLGYIKEHLINMDKVVYVKAYFRPIGKEVTIKVPTGETKKGLFGGEKQVTRKEKQWKQTGFSDSKIDSERLSLDLENNIKSLSEEGFKVQTIIPVTSGAYDFNYKSQSISSSKRILSETEAVKGGASYGYGYGYSFTESLIIVATKA